MNDNQLNENRRTMKFGKLLLLVLPAMVALIMALQLATSARAAFPGDNGKIAFVRSFFDVEEDEDVRNIYSINPNGSGLLQLTDAGLDNNPSWSADGLKIAFDREDEEGESDIWVMNANGSGQTNLTNSLDVADEDPTWSPDGTKIAFTTTRDDNFEIYVMNADGTSPINLTDNEASDVDPAWSPDGTKIAFSSNREGNDDIFVMNADGTGVTRLTNTADGDRNPTWSPDGTKIAFIRLKVSTPRLLDVFTMNASDGSDQTNVTNTNDTLESGVAWSPDGTQLVYGQGTDENGSNFNITTKNADGSGNPFNVTTHEDRESRPDWAPFVENPPASDTVYLSAVTSGMTGNGVSFAAADILEWDGSAWSLFFDGSAAGLGLNPSNIHNLNAIHVNAADDLTFTFFQNKINTPGLGNVLGTDIVHFNGSGLELYFDGSDVGLTKVAQEKIDGLHILDGGVSPIGDGCVAYLLISTFGTGKVPAFGGGTISFQGEDVLGFCATSLGSTTAGFWHMVVDGSDFGMPKNSTDSISASDDGETIFLTTKDTFNVDSAAGGHSMVYKFEGGSFSGPFFSAPANGLDEKVDGLHVEGDLP